MNKRRVEKMIVEAMDLLRKDEELVDAEGRIPSRFNGYIASFGPCVVQAGLFQTLAFFSRADRDEQGDAEGKDRKLVVNLMERTLENSGYFRGVGESLLHKVKAEIHRDASRRIRVKSLVLEAATACKLAMRTFPKKKEEGNGPK
jgi:hypothetical protein